MEPHDVSQTARFLRGQNLVDSDCDLVVDRQPVYVGKDRRCVVGGSISCYDSRGGVLNALKLVQICSWRAVQN